MLFDDDVKPIAGEMFNVSKYASDAQRKSMERLEVKLTGDLGIDIKHFYRTSEPNPSWKNAILNQMYWKGYEDKYSFIVTTKGGVWFYKGTPDPKDVKKNLITKIDEFYHASGSDIVLFLNKIEETLDLHTDEF